MNPEELSDTKLRERAKGRAEKKFQLYGHFVGFTLINLVSILANLIVNLFLENDIFWFPWVLIIWGTLLILHFVGTFPPDKAMAMRMEEDEYQNLKKKQENQGK